MMRVMTAVSLTLLIRSLVAFLKTAAEPEELPNWIFRPSSRFTPKVSLLSSSVAMIATSSITMFFSKKPPPARGAPGIPPGAPGIPPGAPGYPPAAGAPG